MLASSCTNVCDDRGRTAGELLVTTLWKDHDGVGFVIRHSGSHLPGMLPHVLCWPLLTRIMAIGFLFSASSGPMALLLGGVCRRACTLGTRTRT